MSQGVVAVLVLVLALVVCMVLMAAARRAAWQEARQAERQENRPLMAARQAERQTARVGRQAVGGGRVEGDPSGVFKAVLAPDLHYLAIPVTWDNENFILAALERYGKYHNGAGYVSYVTDRPDPVENNAITTLGTAKVAIKSFAAIPGRCYWHVLHDGQFSVSQFMQREYGENSVLMQMPTHSPPEGVFYTPYGICKTPYGIGMSYRYPLQLSLVLHALAADVYTHFKCEYMITRPVHTMASIFYAARDAYPGGLTFGVGTKKELAAAALPDDEVARSPGFVKYAEDAIAKQRRWAAAVVRTLLGEWDDWPADGTAPEARLEILRKEQASGIAEFKLQLEVSGQALRVVADESKWAKPSVAVYRTRGLKQWWDRLAPSAVFMAEHPSILDKHDGGYTLDVAGRTFEFATNSSGCRILDTPMATYKFLSAPARTLAQFPVQLSAEFYPPISESEAQAQVGDIKARVQAAAYKDDKRAVFKAAGPLSRRLANSGMADLSKQLDALSPSIMRDG